jgi:hypothetical protein
MNVAEAATTMSEEEPQLTDEQLEMLRTNAASARRSRVWVSRFDPASFAELILRDEDTGEEIENADIHEEWHDILDTNKRVILWSHPEAGKTNQVCIARTLWELGKNHNLRVVVLSKTYGQAEKITRTIRQLIDGDTVESELVRAVFPTLTPGPKWTDGQFTIKRDIVSKSPSVQAVGVAGAITGSRIDLLIIDDILDHENTRTPAQRRELSTWFRKVVLNRLTRNGRIWMTSNAWHPKDLLHEYAKKKSWFSKRFPVIDENGNPTWEIRWPKKRIDEMREEVGSLEFARAFLCKPHDETVSRFEDSWLRLCLEQGEGYRLRRRLLDVPDGCAVFTGVDLGVKKKRKSGKAGDRTVLFTALVDEYGQRRLLWIESGRWKGPEIVRRIKDTWERYQGIIIVEDVAAQAYILQFVEEEKVAIPIRPFTTTGQRKHDPSFGIESMAVEMERGKWAIPNRGGNVADEVDEWLTEMLSYDPDPNAHTGDRLMASWFCREAARLWDRKQLRKRRRQEKSHKAGGTRVIG